MGSTAGRRPKNMLHGMAMLLFVVIFLLSSASAQTCSSPLVGVVDGNIRLGLLFPFSGKDGEFCSNEPVVENIVLVEAAIYAVKNLPDASRIPGVTIGLEAFDSCSSAQVGVKNVLKYIDTQVHSLNGSLCSDVILRPGIIGPLVDEVALATSPLLSLQNIPLISYGATLSVLTEDREEHGSFLSLVPPNKKQAQVLVDLLWNMRWDYVGVLYSESMETVLDELQSKANDAGICLAETVRFTPRQNQELYEDGITDILQNHDIKVVVLLLEDNTIMSPVMEAIISIGDAASDLHWVANVQPTPQLLDTYKDVIRGLLSITYTRNVNNDFKTYLSSLNLSLVSAEENPWFTRAWEAIHECDLSQDGGYGVPCNQSAASTLETFTSHDITTSNIIDAVFVYAEALASLHKELCGNRVGICERFGSVVGGRLFGALLADEFTGALNNTIMFEDNGEPKHIEFEIANVQLENNGNTTLFKVGVWDSDAGITLNTNVLQLWTSYEKLEVIPTSTCQEPCANLVCLSSSSAKSFAIDGDVILAGMFSIHDINCSDFKSSGYIRMQAVLYAIQRINEDQNILPNVTIGIEAFDICSDSKVAGTQTFQFSSGFQNTKELFMKREKGGNHQYAVGVIGADRSDLTTSINQQLNAVDMVQVGYLSTSSSDGLKLDNFYHVVGTDEQQTRTMIDILLRAQYKYVQIVGSKYANEAVDTLKDLANKADISIANVIVAEDDTSLDYIIHRLLAYPTANVIVLFLEASHIKQFLGALGSAGLQQQFQIIASDEWGLDPSVVDEVESVAENSITISPKSVRNADFESYFTGLHPDNAMDPWFAEFWMERHKCQLPRQPILYDESCSDSRMLSVDDAQSRTISSVVDAVYVLATALDLLVRDKCPEVRNMCTNIASVPIDEWLSYIDRTAIESSSGSGVAIEFDHKREVTAVYDVNKYQGLNSEFGYQTIGSWQEDVGLEGLDASDFKSLMSECLREKLSCSKEQPQLSIIDGDITIPALFSIHEAGASALTCGTLNLKQIVAVQALIYAMEEINKDNSILPELTLGAAIANYCGSSLMAYDQFVNIVSNTSRYGHDFALFGPVDAEVASTVVPNAINPLGFTSILPSALGNDSVQLAPYYIYTKSSPEQVVSSLTDLVRYFYWTYIAILFTDSVSDRRQAELFINKMETLNVCVAVTKVMPVGGDKLKMDGIISQISTSGVGVVFAFLSDEHFSLLLESKTTFGSNDVNMMWVGSFPSTKDLPAFKNSNMATLSTLQYQYNLNDFKTYLTNVNPLHDNANPWFREYFETITNCRLQNDYTSSVPVCEEGLTLASVDESLLHISDLVADAIMSVYMIAQAAHNRLLSLCGENSVRICSKFLEPNPNGVHNAIENVEIHPSISDEAIKFDDGVIQEKISIVNQIGGQTPEEIEVGNWFSGTLTIDATDIKSYGINGNIQEGVRSSKCPDDSCTCSTSRETNGDVEDLNASEAIEWNVDGYWVTIVLTVSATCSVLMLLIIGYLCYYRRHTVAIEASISLSCWLVIGLILMYIMNLPFMVKPTVIVCGVRRVGVSFVYAIVFSALSVKIIRINRLRRRLVPEEPIGFTGASSQTLFFFVFLLAEIVLVVEWLILDNPTTVLNSNNEMQCSFEKLDLIASLSYACFVVIFALIASIGALNSSSVNSEARFIFLACLSTICCVAAWTCVYVLADDTELYEIPSVCVGLTVNSTLIFVAIFFPKVNALCNVYSEKTEKPVRNAKMGQAYANTALHTNEDEALTNL